MIASKQFSIQHPTYHYTYRMYRWKKIYLGGVVSGNKGYLSMHNSVYLYSNLNATEFAMTRLVSMVIIYVWKWSNVTRGMFSLILHVQPSLGCCVKQNFQWTSVNRGGATMDWPHAHVRSKGASHVTIASSGRIRNFNMEPIIGTGNYIHNTALTLWHHSIAQKLKHDGSLTGV